MPTRWAEPASSVGAFEEKEVGAARRCPGAGPARGPSPGRVSPRLWATAGLVAVACSLWSAGVGREPLANPAGLEQLRRFLAASVRPEVSGDFLARTLDGAVTTVAFAVLGTVLAVLVGIVGGILTSELWWGPAKIRPGRVTRPRRWWYLGRGALGLPRGVHEAVWALVLVNMLGRDPLVAILAIAIPFGAVTAKVYAELIDEAPRQAYDALRGAGAGRTAAMTYGMVPYVGTDLVSYGFYRFECSLRSAVILGMIGAGGLGFQLNLSFASLEYREMWTLIYTLVLISAFVEAGSGALRRRRTRRRAKVALAVSGLLMAASLAHVRPDPTRLVSERTRSLLVDTTSAAWPPSLPADGWAGLAGRTLDTAVMSLLAIAFAAAAAIVVAFVAARSGKRGWGRVVGGVARGVLLVSRTIPAPVWALLALFVLFPGPVPGAVALGLYNFGVLGRLMAEAVENLDPAPGEALRKAGAPAVSVFAYATVPASAARFAAYSLYRWEVIARETVVVGVVGAGGLGNLLEQQRAAFDYAGMFGTVLALIVLALLIDGVSAAVRRSLRPAGRPSTRWRARRG